VVDDLDHGGETNTDASSPNRRSRRQRNHFTSRKSQTRTADAFETRLQNGGNISRAQIACVVRGASHTIALDCGHAPSNVWFVSLPDCDQPRAGDVVRTGASIFRIVVAFAFVVCAGAVVSGCAGNCATGCPNTLFDVFASPNENLNIATTQLVGPGCPPVLAGCRGDLAGTNSCVRLSLVASQPGACELDMTFSDSRTAVSIKTEFGAETHQGCCQGFPVIGPGSYTIPTLGSPPPVDAGSDAADAAVDATTDVAADAPTRDDASADVPADSGNGDA
jgi:hypothetical protein